MVEEPAAPIAACKLADPAEAPQDAVTLQAEQRRSSEHALPKARSSTKQPAQQKKLTEAEDPHAPTPPKCDDGAEHHRQFVPRAAPIRRDVELQMYGYTSGCPGCDAAQNDKPAAKHSPACRERITAAMSDDPDGYGRLLNAEIRKAAHDVNEASAQPESKT